VIIAHLPKIHSEGVNSRKLGANLGRKQRMALKGRIKGPNLEQRRPKKT
jgi:hypothetical protein